MIHYTIVPLEKVFEGFDQFRPSFEEIDFGGKHLIVEKLSGSQVRVERIISGNAADYLNPAISPGSVIDLAGLSDI